MTNTTDYGEDYKEDDTAGEDSGKADEACRIQADIPDWRMSFVLSVAGFEKITTFAV